MFATVFVSVKYILLFDFDSFVSLSNKKHRTGTREHTVLQVWLRKFIEVGPHAVDFEHHEWVKHLWGWLSGEWKKMDEGMEGVGKVQSPKTETCKMSH